ncbi:DUF2537 domain-containing protein [Saccharothrix longispora]|uniref:DUF2537 domain-containing protein n=1 Tax=Saccharothrix longispora TaxID=33920 RepID=UPI0028FDBA1B|nr:DUF2537 domain-containing protein [Saccharothrix longispora]MDU0293286.1 DUF2537 domain-containing protein [Saccharothrix longispora]
MELRVQDGRAVLAGSGDAGEHEVDPHTLPLGAGLAEALHEWAKVADAVSRTDSPSEGVAEALVTRRGRQLAGRLAADMGSPVRYTDPVTGDVVTVDVPAAEDEPRPDESRPGEARPDGPDDADAAEAGQAPEPTPWGTGLTVSLITAAVVTFTVFTLSVGLGETSQWLALLANVLVVGGISPSVWLARRVPVWRWVAYGVVAGVLAAWLSLLLNGLL